MFELVNKSYSNNVNPMVPTVSKGEAVNADPISSQLSSQQWRSMTQDTSPSTKKTLFKVMECRKLFEQFTMLALIIGVCKALTVLTMKHCKNTIEFAWMKKMSIICSKWNLLTFDWIKLHNLCIYERQQLWIFNVLSSNLSSILGQIICCEMITSSEKLISKSKAMDRRIKKKKTCQKGSHKTFNIFSK